MVLDIKDMIYLEVLLFGILEQIKYIKFIHLKEDFANFYKLQKDNFKDYLNFLLIKNLK